MGTCKGNRGNLLQHWVLCEVLTALGKSGIKSLRLITTHSMAPGSALKARRGNSSEEVFDSVRNSLANSHEGAYLKAWHKLTDGSTASLGLRYPSSAAFAHSLWSGSLCLFLCEKDKNTYDEIDTWLAPIKTTVPRRGSEARYGPWWNHLDAAFSNAEQDACFVEMDPNKYSLSAAQSPFDLDRVRLRLVLDACKPVTKPIVIQISTYSSGDNNQSAVETEIATVMCGGGFQGRQTIRADHKMMSLLFWKELPDGTHPQLIADKFPWREGVSKEELLKLKNS